MATVTVTVCDMCTEEQVVSVETIHFDVDGVDYESDLCAAHLSDWKSLETSRRQFAAMGRSQGAALAPPAPAARSRVGDTAERREENREVRAFAKQQGLSLGERGRIPDDIRDRFRKWKWEQNHPTALVRPVPSPPRVLHTTQTPPAANGEGRQRLDPASAMATHSESRPY